MSTLIKGLVESVRSSEGKFGPMFTIYVNGVGYGTGKTSQGVNQGDFVEFTATQKPGTNYWNVDKGTIKPAERPSSVSKPAFEPKTMSSPVHQTPYVDTRQLSIEFQSSRKDAIEYLGLLLANGMIDFGKAKGAEKMAIAELHLDSITDHFFKEAVARKTSQSQEVSNGVSEETYTPKARTARTAVKQEPVEFVDDDINSLPF